MQGSSLQGTKEEEIGVWRQSMDKRNITGREIVPANIHTDIHFFLYICQMCKDK